MKKKLLITVGPQGSGNHIFSRIFSMHQDVFGWKDLIDHYWVKHGREPFIEYWIYPELLTEDFFKDNQYFFANVSFPVHFEGMRYFPKILEVIKRVKDWNIDVVVAIINRDDTINRMQQKRLRAEETIDQMHNYVDKILEDESVPVHFLSLETFFSYKKNYLKYLTKLLDFPIDYQNPNILKFISESPNKKYIKYIENYWLDEQTAVGLTLEKLSNPKNLIRKTTNND